MYINGISLLNAGDYSIIQSPRSFVYLYYLNVTYLLFPIQIGITNQTILLGYYSE